MNIISSERDYLIHCRKVIMGDEKYTDIDGKTVRDLSFVLVKESAFPEVMINMVESSWEGKGAGYHSYGTWNTLIDVIC